MVGGEDDDGVVEHACRLESIQDPADFAVDHRDVGEIVGPLPMPFFPGRVDLVAHRVVVAFDMLAHELLEGDRLALDVACCHGTNPEIAIEVGFSLFGRRIVGRVRPREAHLKEERLAGRLALDPVDRQSADEGVGMEFLRERPFERAEPVGVVVEQAVARQAGLLEIGLRDRLVPFVDEVAAALGHRAILVLDDHAGVEAGRRIHRLGVHLAHVDAFVAGLGEVLDPAVPPRRRVVDHARGVRIVAGEQARAGRHAGSGGGEAGRQIDAFARHAVEIRRIDMGKPERIDGVVALLVGDDEDDIRPAGHRVPGQCVNIILNRTIVLNSQGKGCGAGIRAERSRNAFLFALAQR